MHTNSKWPDDFTLAQFLEGGKGRKTLLSSKYLAINYINVLMYKFTKLYTHSHGTSTNKQLSCKQLVLNIVLYQAIVST